MKPIGFQKTLSSGLVLQSAFGTENSIYPDVLQVRIGSNPRFQFDDYSHHYLLRNSVDPIGSMTITRNIDGPVDCQSLYPKSLFQEFGATLISTCKFRIISGTHNGFRTLRNLIREVWLHQTRDGMRLDLINSTLENVRFYKRIGYTTIENSEFRHPTLGTQSVAMFMATDPSVRSFIQKQCARLSNPLRLSTVQKAINAHLNKQEKYNEHRYDNHRHKNERYNDQRSMA